VRGSCALDNEPAIEVARVDEGAADILSRLPSRLCVMSQASLPPVFEEELDHGPARSFGRRHRRMGKVVTTMWHPVGTGRMVRMLKR
jgi:hypothetical protein